MQRRGPVGAEADGDGVADGRQPQAALIPTPSRARDAGRRYRAEPGTPYRMNVMSGNKALPTAITKEKT